MSSFNRRSVLLMAAGLPLVAGCGFEPVYGPDSAATRPRNAILVDAPSNADQFELVRQLEYRLGAANNARFGLSVALAVVSAWIQLPVPGHLAASAAIASDGRLERVGRLADKVGLLRDLLPGVRTLAVASEQAEDWRRMVAQTAGVQVQVVGFPSVAAAITHFFAPGDALASVPASEHSRVVFGLSSLMARGQGALPDWKPVVSAVATIRAHWSLSSDDRHRLDLLDLVARRYAKLALPTAPPGGSLAELVDQASQRSALERGVHLALLVEHCSFLDLPLPASLAAAIRPHLDADLHPFSFDVRGAYARWQGTHDPVAALVAQQALLTELIAGRRLDSCSHALNEAIRLAAVLGDRTAFGHLLDTESRLHELGGLGPVDRTFVDAVVCGGAALLALPELSERRWARLAEGVGPKSYLQSWAHRMRCLSGLARAEDWPLLPHHLALHQLAQGDVTLDQACAALGSGRALAGRLAEQGVDHLLRFYPS